MNLRSKRICSQAIFSTPSKNPLIYLASQSSRRKQILQDMGIRFRIVPSTYHEKLLKVLPEKLVLMHAEGKARSSVLPQKARFVLAADTLVWRDRFFGKPKNLSHAKRMLKALSGKTHSVYTGVVVWDRRTDNISKGVAKTDVTFKKLSKTDIHDYFRLVNPLDKAGAYAIQEGPPIVRKIKGSYSNVVGLPKGLLRSLIRSYYKKTLSNEKPNELSQKSKPCKK